MIALFDAYSILIIPALIALALCATYEAMQ